MSLNDGPGSRFCLSTWSNLGDEVGRDSDRLHRGGLSAGIDSWLNLNRPGSFTTSPCHQKSWRISQPNEQLREQLLDN